MGKLWCGTIYSLLALLMLSSCFAPGSLADAAGGACSSKNFFVYGKWKLVKGYPSGWGYGGVDPSLTQLKSNFRILTIERGVDMCMMNIINEAMQYPPVFRMKYSHDTEAQVMQVSTFWSNAQNQANWAKDTVTYRVVGCKTSNPQLILTYLSGRTETYEVFNRNVKAGDCGNPPNPSGS